jgi:hypothetical protein
MFDKNTLAQLHANYLATRPQPVQQPQQKKKGGRGGFLTSLISEGGAIGGGAAGAAAGSAILPGIGTLLGGALGAGIGAFTGRVAENKVRDNRLGLGDALKEGAVSGLLGGGPLRLGAAAANTVKGVVKGAGLKEALQVAGDKAVNMSATRAVGNKLAKSGEGLIAKEFRLNPTQQANFKKVHGEEAVSVLRKYGVKKPEDLQANIKPLQDAFDGVVDQIPAASKLELTTAMKKVYQPLLDSPVVTRQQLGQALKTQATAITKKYGTEVPAAELNTLRKAFDDAVNYTQRGTNEFTVNKKSADAIRKLLQGKADQAGITVDGKTFKDVGLELRKLRNLDDIVGKQSYLGTGNLPLGLPNLLGTIGGGAAGGLPGVAVGGLLTSAVNSPVGRRALANTTLKTGEKLIEKSTGTNPYGLRGITGRIAPAGLAGAMVGAQNQSLDSNITQPTTQTTTATSMANIPGLSQLDANMSTDNNPLAPENLQSSIEQILSNGGTIEDAAKFVSLADSLQKIQTAGQGKQKLNATQLQQANNAQSGLASLATIQQTLSAKPNAAKLASLPGGSFTRSLTGTGSYGAAISNATDVIGRLRSGGAINADEEKRFKDLLPSTFDDPETINYKLNALASLFQRFANPQSAQADPTDLAGALAANGY